MSRIIIENIWQWRNILIVTDNGERRENRA
jgi:hypothetical protein